MRRERILILGGTGDARRLARQLVADGFSVITSLAGVTENPVLPEGDVRRGGFGGADGLADYIRSEKVDLLIDASHPFAAQISANAHAACGRLGVPLLRLERPAWEPAPNDQWRRVATAADAALALPSGARVLLTIGRKEVAPFFSRPDISGIARMIEPPPATPPDGWRIVLERPPFTIASETLLMNENRISWLVTKNAGGAETEGKLIAARELGIGVIMVERPQKPMVPTLADSGLVAAEIRKLLSP